MCALQSQNIPEDQREHPQPVRFGRTPETRRHVLKIFRLESVRLGHRPNRRVNHAACRQMPAVNEVHADRRTLEPEGMAGENLKIPRREAAIRVMDIYVRPSFA